MIISVSFSLVIYRMVTSELDRVLRTQRLRLELRLPDRFGSMGRRIIFDRDVIEETNNRIKVILFTINLAILAGSAGARIFFGRQNFKTNTEYDG